MLKSNVLLYHLTRTFLRLSTLSLLRKKEGEEKIEKKFLQPSLPLAAERVTQRNVGRVS